MLVQSLSGPIADVLQVTAIAGLKPVWLPSWRQTVRCLLDITILPTHTRPLVRINRPTHIRRPIRDFRFPLLLLFGLLSYTFVLWKYSTCTIIPPLNTTSMNISYGIRMHSFSFSSEFTLRQTLYTVQSESIFSINNDSRNCKTTRNFQGQIWDKYKPITPQLADRKTIRHLRYFRSKKL